MVGNLLIDLMITENYDDFTSIYSDINAPLIYLIDILFSGILSDDGTLIFLIDILQKILDTNFHNYKNILLCMIHKFAELNKPKTLKFLILEYALTKKKKSIVLIKTYKERRCLKMGGGSKGDINVGPYCYAKEAFKGMPN